MAKQKIEVVIDGKNNASPAIKQVSGDINGLSSAAKAAGLAIAGALTVDAFSGWIKGATDAAAEIGKLAQLSGTTAEAFSQWGFAARTVGVENDKLADIFKDVQEKFGEFAATGGGGAADFFEFIAPKIGMTAEQFRGLAGPDALQLYVKGLEEANLSQDQMIFYLESLASDASLLLPLLRNGGAEFTRLAKQAREFGLIIGSDTAARAKEFNEQLQTLGAVSQSVGQQVAAEMLPAMNDLSGLMIDFAKDSEGASVAAGAVGFAMKSLATVVIVVGSTFANLGRAIGASAAAAAAAARGQFTEAKNIFGELAADNQAGTDAMNRRIENLWNGTYEKQGQAATKAADELDKVQKGTQTKTVSYVDVMAEQYKKLADVAKTKLSALTSAESKAKSDLEKIRADRLAIEQRYTEALAGLQGGGEASYGAAEDLKIKARQALANKDVANAQAYAQQALQMIQDLAAAGESTYGFEGFIKELQGIELAANGIEQTGAEQKLAALTQEMERIKASADPLKELKIDFKLAPEDVERVKALMAQLAADLGQQLVIPVTPVAGDAVLANVPEPPKFATGGYISGPGSGTSDSILARLSNGEFVMRAAAVQHYGPQLLSMMNGLQLPKFADGGLVAGITPAAGRDLGSVTLNMGGGTSLSLLADGPGFEKVLHIAALKRGRTTRR